MGEPAEQDEDCLSLNVWTPAPDRSARPVLVWLHGGGYVGGAGSTQWYAGDRLAERGDVVVVTVNYRLGALGFLCYDGISSGNLGLLDVIAALRWVRENIADFGGDREQVTVAGHSAGAHMIPSLLANPNCSGLFRRAVLQSGPFGIRPAGIEQASGNARLLMDELGVAPHDAHLLHKVSVPDLLRAQQAVAVQRTAAATDPFDLTPPFFLVANGTVAAADPVAAACDRADGTVDLLLGWTAQELTAFFGHTTEFRQLSTAGADAMNERFFRGDALRLASAYSVAGSGVFAYQFDWRPAGSPLGACHCVELACLFDHPTAWRAAPMVSGGVPRALVDAVQQAWLGFVRSGQPGPDWPGHDVVDRHIKHFDH